MDLQERGWEAWTGLICFGIVKSCEFPYVNAVMNLRVPQNVENFLTS